MQIQLLPEHQAEDCPEVESHLQIKQEFVISDADETISSVSENALCSDISDVCDEDELPISITEKKVNECLMSVEDKLEAAIINWSLECPNVPELSVSKLLHHVNNFFPGIPLTSKTLKKQGKLDVDICDMHFGRYTHMKNWQTSTKKYLESINFIGYPINVDRIPLFNDSRKYHAYPILLEVCTTPSRIFCAVRIFQNQNCPTRYLM